MTEDITPLTGRKAKVSSEINIWKLDIHSENLEIMFVQK